MVKERERCSVPWSKKIHGKSKIKGRKFIERWKMWRELKRGLVKSFGVWFD